MKKRMGVFVFYDANGYVGRYVEYLLSEMMRNLDELVIVVNGSLSYEGKNKLLNFTNEIYIRENKGFDATAWKDAILKFVGIERMSTFDDVVFFNDICYGPFFPMKEVFENMDLKSKLDFWGITRHYQAIDFTGHHKGNILPEHIQTYFFVVRKNMLINKSFTQFWQDMKEIITFEDDIGAFESSFTKYFSDRGFKWDTFVEMDSLKGEGFNNYSFNYDLPYVLLSEYKMPFVRRKSLTQFVPNSCGGPEKDPRRVLEYIKEHTQYDLSMIWEDLLRKNNIADLYSRLHLDYILPKKGVIYNHRKVKIALLMHIYYSDQIEYCLNFAKSIPNYADVYVTTIAKNKDQVQDAFSSLKCNKLEVRIVENRGRDMSALYVGCADIIGGDEYDYVCCIHDKKSPQVGLLFGRAFRDLTFENVLASSDFVDNVIGVFEENPQLGYLGFPYMIGGPYWPVLCNAWASENNFDKTKEILERCHVNVNLSKEKPPILYANVFWCRPTALRPITNLKLQYGDFEDEPLPIDGTFSHALERAVTYVSQSQGYFSGVLYTDEYASIYIPALMLAYRGAFSTNRMIDWSVCDSAPRRYLVKSIVKITLKKIPILYALANKVWCKIK